MDEKYALRTIRRGEQSGLGWIIDRYTSYVSAIVGKITGGYARPSDVEELVSDVFVALWQEAECVRPEKLRPWLGSVARNKARDFLRRLKEELPLEEDTLPWEFDLEDKAQQEELYDAVRKAVLDMGETDREIFLRHYYYFQPLKDIAVEMDMKESTVKSRLRRGRQALKQKLIEGGFADEIQNQ